MKVQAPTLEVYLHLVYPRLALYWDGKPRVYMSYDSPSGGGGTSHLGRSGDDAKTISEGIVKELKEIYRPRGTKIRFWNGDKTYVHIVPGEIIAPPLTGKLEESRYQEIIANLKKGTRIRFKTAP